MRTLFCISILALCCTGIHANAQSASAAASQDQASTVIRFHTVHVDGVSIFYREAGPQNAPTILLLHGFPSSSRMFDPLFQRLAGKYHLVAPDYPGFGHSDHPNPATFAYTFDHLAAVMDHFVTVVGLTHYSLYLQDYGGPIGFRLAIAHPERLQSFILQNAVAHEDGLGLLWAPRRAFWADRAANEARFRATFFSLDTTRQRHIGKDPDTSRYDPDLWSDEFAFLNQPGTAQIQSDLFYDYRTNVASYPQWQAWLRAHQPRMLVLWGKYDPSFQVAEATAYQRDVKAAEVHVLDAGHFALDTNADSIAVAMDRFLSE